MAIVKKLGIISITLIFLFLNPARGFTDIRIGVAISLTGKYEKPGNMVCLGYKLWEKEVNERGGLLGEKVKLIIFDDESDAEKSFSLYSKLIKEEKVDLVLSPYSSSITYKVSRVTERYHYPMLVAGASDPHIWLRGYKYLFGMYALADRYFMGFLDIVAEYGFQKLVVVTEKDRFPLSAAEGIEKWSERFGLKVLDTIVYPKGRPDFVSIVAKIKKLAPDAMVLCAYPDDVYALMDSMKRAKYRPRAFAATIAPTFKDFGLRLGKDAEGVFGPSQWEANTRIPFPGTKKFIRSFKEFTKLTPTYHAASGYAACEILEKSINKVGAKDREKIASAIRQMDTYTVLGRFRVDDRGIQVGHNPITIQWQNGKREIIWPRRMQTANPIFPVWYK